MRLEVRGVNHKVCHDIFMNASIYALEVVATGLRYMFEHHVKCCFFLLKVALRKVNVGEKMK